MYFESHAHYDDDRYANDREEIISAIKSAGVDKVINIGSDMTASLQSIRLAETYPFFYASVGVHPYDVANMKEADLETLAGYTKHNKVVAIGEIGLDYSHPEPSKQLQKIWFEEQLNLAKEFDMPVVVHSRDASSDTFNILKNSGIRRCVVHCYSGNWELAMEYAKLGFFIGVGGVVTFKNGRRLVESVQALPLEHILIETDCPYLSPEPNRGVRNDSRNLKYITDKIAELKNVTPDEVARVTYSNAQALFFG